MVFEGRIESVSGIRAVVGKWLNPVVAAEYAAYFGTFCEPGPMVVGRDSRPSGRILSAAIVSTLSSLGRNVYDLGIVPTPTVGFAAGRVGAGGAVAVTASHNPIEWNALKLFSERAVFLTQDEFQTYLEFMRSGNPAFADNDGIGKLMKMDDAIDSHVGAVISCDYVNPAEIASRGFSVAVDCVNGAASNAASLLLERLGCNIVPIHCEESGHFPRGAEPVEKNLKDLSAAVVSTDSDVGFAFDPDGDRLAVVDEQGRPLGEERTLVMATELVLTKNPGPVVANVSTTSALDMVAETHGCRVHRTMVGEINVSERMREVGAVVGGEGNGGVIVPCVQYLRDGISAAALVLQLMAERGRKISEISNALPERSMIKGAFKLRPEDPQEYVASLLERFSPSDVDEQDGMKMFMGSNWLHVRASRTEPVLRVIVETGSAQESLDLLEEVSRVIVTRPRE